MGAGDNKTLPEAEQIASLTLACNVAVTQATKAERERDGNLRRAWAAEAALRDLLALAERVGQGLDPAAAEVAAARLLASTVAIEAAEARAITNSYAALDAEARVEAVEAREERIVLAANDRFLTAEARVVALTEELAELKAGGGRFASAVAEAVGKALWIAALDRVAIEDRVEWVAELTERYELVAAAVRPQTDTPDQAPNL